MAILDVDVHHGNGSQAIFWERPDVLYVSLHSDPRGMYPYFVGHDDEVGSGAGTSRTSGSRRRWAQTTRPISRRSSLGACPDRGVRGLNARSVSLGLDTYALDPIGGFALTTSGYAAMGRRVARLGLPTVVLQEGGYHIEDLGINVVVGRPAGLSLTV